VNEASCVEPSEEAGLNEDGIEARLFNRMMLRYAPGIHQRETEGY
jgi:hypothetical protein